MEKIQKIHYLNYMRKREYKNMHFLQGCKAAYFPLSISTRVLNAYYFDLSSCQENKKFDTTNSEVKRWSFYG